jgi:hypothetical protein
LLQSPSSYARHCALLAGSHEIARQSALPRKGYPSPGRVVTWLQHGIRGLVRYYTSPWIPSRPHCRKWIALFSGTACVFRLMFFAAQRSRVPFTAMPSKPHGPGVQYCTFTPEPSQRPLWLTGRAGGLQTLTGALSASAPHPEWVPLHGASGQGQSVTIQDCTTVRVTVADTVAGAGLDGVVPVWTATP